MSAGGGYCATINQLARLELSATDLGWAKDRASAKARVLGLEVGCAEDEPLPQGDDGDTHANMANTFITLMTYISMLIFSRGSQPMVTADQGVCVCEQAY
jgi:hypothetical protein